MATRDSVSETGNLKLIHLRQSGAHTKPASTTSHFQFQGVGCIQRKTGDMGLAIGYADILDKITTFTIQDPK